MRGWGITVLVLVTLGCSGAAPQHGESTSPPPLPGSLSAKERAARWAEDDAKQERHLAELAAERARAEQQRQDSARRAAEQFAAEQRQRQADIARVEAEAEAQRRETERKEQQRDRARSVSDDSDDSEPSGGYCCKVCHKGCACGNTCISCSYTCHVGPGCACDG
jgi:hypothetical protein